MNSGPPEVTTASQVLVRHPVGSVIALVVLIAVMYNGFVLIIPSDLNTPWFNWTVVAFAALCWAIAFVVHRIDGRSREELLTVSWSFAMSPVLLVLGGALLWGAPDWLLLLMPVGSVLVVALVTFLATRSSSTPS